MTKTNQHFLRFFKKISLPQCLITQSHLFIYLIISISEEKFLIRKAKGSKSPQDADSVFIPFQFLPQKMIKEK